MGSPFKELFHQGIVTARDPSMLQEGELVQADDCIYRPNDPAIHKAPGRTAYGTVMATTISGVTLSASTATKTNGFGSDIPCTTTSGSTDLGSAALFTAGMAGYRVYGTGIPVGTYVRLYSTTSLVRLTKPATATGTVTLTLSPHEPGDFVKGTLTGTNVKILTVTNASSIVLNTGVASGTDTIIIAPSIKELLYLSFPGTGSDVLLAYAGSRVFKSDYTGGTGTFSLFLWGLANAGDENMEAIRTGDKYVLLSTGNAPRVVYYKDVGGVDTLSSRLQGMQPVNRFSLTVSSGAWPVALGTATYFFFVTEVFNSGEADEVEGTFSGDPLYATITNVSTQAITITRNDAVNTGTDGRTNAATHWRVYMSQPQPLTTPVPALHTFRRIVKDISIEQTSITISDSNPVTGNTSGRLADNTGYSQPFYNQTGALAAAAQLTASSATFGTGVLAGTFTIASGTPVTGMAMYGIGIAPGTVIVQVDPGVSPFTIHWDKPTTAGSSGTYYLGPGRSDDGNVMYDAFQVGAGVRISNFGFKDVGTYTGKTVIGVVVRILYKWNTLLGGGDADSSGNDRGFNIKMTVGGADTNTKLNVGHRSGQGATPTIGGNRWGAIEAGAAGDTWGRTWNTGLQDFIDGNFFVHIYKAGSKIDQEHFIDAVEVRVYFSGVDVNLDGAALPTIIYTSQIGEQITIGAAGPPPSCDTGDINEGQLLTNDTDNSGLMWATVPDEFEQYPTLYQNKLSSRYADRIMVIRRTGSAGGVYCRNSIKRLNYFPTEQDADAQRGRSWEDVATGHGAASKRGVVVFDHPQRGTLGAYVSMHGLMLTDLVNTWPANTDLDWVGTVNTSLINTCKLVDYPQLFVLALYYVPLGSAYHTRVLYFCYHPSHLKEGGKLAAIGPVQCRAKAATRTNLGNVTKLLTGNLSDGKVYLEDSGYTSEDALVTITPTIVTRLIYASDVGGEARIERAWLRVAAAGDATTGVCSLQYLRQNIGENVTLADTKSFTTDATTLTGNKLLRLDPDNMGESFQIKITKADLNAPFRLHYATLLGEGYGLESNRA